VTAARLPDFLIIGAMKAGTTTLFRWLGEHPACQLPADKEPHFFSRDDHYARGVGAYTALFEGIPRRLLTGEASVGYSRPEYAQVSAARITALLPGAKLIFLARDPLARTRSHYLHELKRGREKRTFAAAVADASSPYVHASRYSRCLKPYSRTITGPGGCSSSQLSP
jgi:hypothetical protein